MSEGEFWELTLREFDRLSDCRRELDYAEDLRVGLICSVLCNVNRADRKSHVFTPQDFVGNGPNGKTESPRRVRDEQPAVDRGSSLIAALDAFAWNRYGLNNAAEEAANLAAAATPQT